MDTRTHREITDLPERFKSYIRTLSRVHEQEVILPDQLRARAVQVLKDRFEINDSPVSHGFCHGALGLLAQHTRFIGGFAVLLPVHQGVAVAVQQSAASDTRVVVEGYGKIWDPVAVSRQTFDESEMGPDAWMPVVAGVLDLLGNASGLRVSIVCSLQVACFEPILAAISVALLRAIAPLHKLDVSEDERLAQFQTLIARYLGSEYNLAYLVGACYGKPQHFVCVDAVRGEFVSIDGPEKEDMTWALLDLGTGPPLTAAQYQKNLMRAKEAVPLLQKAGYVNLSSVAEIEHEDLEKAMTLLPRRYRQVIRHLAQDNRRVQNMINAIRRQDWQMVGALLLMSHASLKSDWAGTNAQVDRVVEIAESMAFEGVFGACMTGRSGCVLLGGRPRALNECIKKIKHSFEESGEFIPLVQRL